MNLIFANSDKRHICYVKNSRIGYDLPLSVNNRVGAQWLSGRVLDLRPKGCGFESHRRHCVVVLEQDKFILA